MTGSLREAPLAPPGYKVYHYTTTEVTKNSHFQTPKIQSAFHMCPTPPLYIVYLKSVGGHCKAQYCQKTTISSILPNILEICQVLPSAEHTVVMK